MITRTLNIVAAIGLAAALVSPAQAGVKASYLYNFSNLEGVVATDWAALTLEQESGEVLVLDSSNSTVAVYDRHGMESYTFGEDSELGIVSAVAAMEGGDLLVLSANVGPLALHRCNFRGELIGKVPVKGAPAEFLAEFAPTTLRYRGGRVYLVDMNLMKVLVARPDGTTVATHDFREPLGLVGKRWGDAGMTGFGVDAKGNMLFTTAPIFKAHVASPSGSIRSFGEHGSTPGRFNVIGGIDADEDGNLYIVDTLRAVILVFSPELEFLGEFGGHGFDRGQLVAPKELVVWNNRVFVSQARRRGVSVFNVVSD